MTKDLRSYINELKQSAPDEIAVVSRKADRKFELSAVLARLEVQKRYPAVIFENVNDFSMPVVSNVFATRKRMAIALGCDEKDLHRTYRERENNRLEPVMVNSGPVKEIIKTEEADLTELPVILHNEKDAGPYITGGAMVMKDPETGIRNIGIYRHQIFDKKQMGVHFAETNNSNYIFHQYIEQNRPMEVAVTIGMHPVFYMGILSVAPVGVDEYEVVGGLMQQPLELVKCETVDLEVPATAEIVIEGTVDPQKQKLEAPFGEYNGLYGGQLMNPVVDITAITMRKNPIYLDIFSGYTDQQLLGGTARLGSVYQTIKMACPTVKDIFMPPSGFCRLICYIAIEKRFEGEAKNAICAAFAADGYVRYVIVVDSDINIFDDSHIWSAIASRVNLEDGVILIKNTKGHPLDPTAKHGYLVHKVGIDATKPLTGYPEAISVPGVDKIDLDLYFDK